MPLMWFIYSVNVCSGPFETEVVQTKIDNGQLEPNALIWQKGQRAWMTIREWESRLAKTQAQAARKSIGPVWYVDLGNSLIGPLTEVGLVTKLKSWADLSKVKLWTAGMENWTSLFALQEVMDLVGATRREVQRAPMTGSVVVSRLSENPKSFALRAISISIGGMGVSGAHELKRGDEVSLKINSQVFPKTIHLSGEIAYVTKSGFCGARFVHTPAESNSMIFDLVKKFNLDQAKEPGSISA